MKDRDEQSDSIVIADFLTRYVEDEARGEVQTLARYQALYPGFEEAVAREFLDLEDRRRTRGAGAEDERRVGHYRLLHPLGRGGQGEVHLAEDVRLKRKVALKVIRGWDRDRIHRLRREAEAASRLQHPGICVVHDVGEEEGLHYIAMQYVEGQSLEEAIAEAREEGGEIADPVRLLEKVARALHVAHEVGLVHRDVKPGNILVTPEGKPVLLDFGIVLDTEGEGPTLTGTGQMAGTPAYLAPEQLAEPPVLLDRRADVYGLGITLYECLTLRRPFEAPTRDRLYNKILTAPVLDPRPYNPRITRDLKAVLETAMDKDPDRRYQTALDMAEDLRRIQMFEPVRARPAGPGLRLRRWARRNRALAGALLGIFLALVAGLGVSLHFLVESNRDRRLAETNFQRAVKAVDRMLTEVGLSEAQLADLPELDDTRRRLLERALAFYQELLTDPRSGTRVRQGTANAHLRVASIHYRLGNLEAAEQEIHHALAMFRELVAEHPENLGFRSGLVDALGMQPMILASIGRGRESIDLYRKAIASARELLERAPGVKEYMCLLARCLAKCGQQLYTLGDRNAATPAYREAIRLLQGVADLPSCNSVDRFELAVFSVRFATISIGSPHRDEARKRLEEARVVLQNLFEASPHDSSITRYLAEAHLVLGRFEMARSLEKADAYFLAAIKGLEKLVSRHPRQWGGRLVLARSLLYRADNLLIRGKFTEAEEALKRPAPSPGTCPPCCLTTRISGGISPGSTTPSRTV